MPTTENPNLCEALGLAPHATSGQIEKQCISLGERYRPDKNAGDPLSAHAFGLVGQAYETLLDPARRAAYDASLGKQPPTLLEREGIKRVVASAVSTAACLLLVGYLFAYKPYVVQQENVAKAATQEAVRAAQESARHVEAEKKAAQARATEERARFDVAQGKAVEDSARQEEARRRDERLEMSKQAALARLADVEDLARVVKLRDQCNAAAAASAGPVTGNASAAGIWVAAQYGIAFCTQYERAEKERLRYESIRDIDPAAGAKELELQRIAREERRQRTRPVVTNCNAVGPGRATCISQ